jgi:hypothetical protein
MVHQAADFEPPLPSLSLRPPPPPPPAPHPPPPPPPPQEPLLISSLIRHADRHHPDVEIVTRKHEGGIHRYHYADLHKRSRQVANVLQKLGIQRGEGHMTSKSL